MRHYVGVSGVSNHAQQEFIYRTAIDSGINQYNYNLLLGVKATEKTQWQDDPNKYGSDWYPVGEDIRNALNRTIDLDGLVHADSLTTLPAVQMFFGSLADDPELAKAFTQKILDRSSGWIRYAHDGSTAGWPVLQFDRFPWMNRNFDDYFEWLINSTQVSQIILQCHGDYMESFHPYEVVRRLGQIKELGLMSLRVLFDASHGTGKEMNPESLRPFIGGLVDSNVGDEVGVVVAGGLYGDNLEEFIPPLIDEFGLLSWDAEGKLHYKEKVKGGDFIPVQLKRYIEVSAEITRLYGYEEDESEN